METPKRGRPKGHVEPIKTFECKTCGKTLSFNSKSVHNNSEKHKMRVIMAENINENIGNIIKSMLTKKNVV